MAGFLGSIVDSFSNFTGRFHDTSETNSANTNVTSRDDEDTRRPSVEEVSAPITNTSSKRRSGIESGETGRSSKKARQDDYEDNNLEPNYEKHKDARPIPIPGISKYSATRDWEGTSGPRAAEQTRKMAPGHRGGGFRPQNTLNKPTPQASQKASQIGVLGQYASSHPRVPQSPRQSRTLGATQNKGGNTSTISSVPAGDDEIEEVLDVRPSPAKKRKTYEGNLRSDPVDLTDDGEIGIAIGVEKSEKPKRTPAPPQTLQKRAARAETENMFGPTERKRIDHTMKYSGKLKPILQKQRSSESLNSAHSNPRATQEDPLPQRTPRLSMSPAIVIEDSQDSHVTRTAPAAATHGTNHISQAPPINLTEGYDTIREQYQQKSAPRQQQQAASRQRSRQGDTEDLQGANDMLKIATASVSRAKKIKSSFSGSPKGRAMGTLRQKPDGSFMNCLTPEKCPSLGVDESNLRSKFVRDDDTDVVNKCEMKQRSMNRVTSISDDELAGPNNTQKPASLGMSPTRPSSAALRATANSIALDSRPSSPSDLKNTAFGQAKTSTRRPVEQPRYDYSDGEDACLDPEDDEYRIPINAIFCKSCVFEGKGLELVWDPDYHVFEVVHHKQKMKVPGTDTLVTIGELEAATWLQSKDMLDVCLKGSASDVSNGTIVITFATAEGCRICFDCLNYQDNVRIKYHDQVSMTKIIVRQKEDQQILQRTKAATAVAPARAAPGRPAHTVRPPDEPDDEQIIYESEVPALPRPSKLRGRMQARDDDSISTALSVAGYQNVPGSREPESTSRFFQPRRSTRQSKPVEYEERAPTPEKWTRVNRDKLTRWTHPVLYPPEGTQRATVEFHDLERLDEEEWLNDNLVNYELRYIQEHMNPDHKDKVHFFNSFFFSVVSNKNGRRQFNYDAVKRWTRSIDIFTKSYIVVPIAENLHWYVVIICNLPNAQRKIANFDDVESANGTSAAQQDEPDLNEPDRAQTTSDDHTMVPRLPQKTAVLDAADDTITKNDDQPSEEDLVRFQFNEEDKIESSPQADILVEETGGSSRPGTATGRKTKRKKGVIVRRYDPHTPALIALDSFGHPRSQEIKFLKQWVSAEAKSRRQLDLDPGDMQGVNAKGIPEQSNFSDCGIYLLGYIEEFAKDPEAFVQKMLGREKNVVNDFDPSKKREDMRNRILALHDQQENERIARKKLKMEAKRNATSQAPESTHGTVRTSGLTVPTSSQPPVLPTRDSIQDEATNAAPKELPPTKETLSSKTMAGEDELEVAAPLALGSTANDCELSEPQQPLEPSSGKSDEDEEMLDVADSGDDRAVPPQMDSASNEMACANPYAQGLPYDASYNASTQLLEQMQQIANELPDKAKTPEREIIELKDDDEPRGQETQPEIAESQEQVEELQ